MAPRGRMPKEPVVQLSATGLSRLGECEVRWMWHPDEDAPQLAKGRALDLGTLLHAGVEARLRRMPWMPALEALAPPGWEPGYLLPDPFPTAIWLMERHEQVYPTMPQAIATESQFELWLPDAPVPTKVRGRNDGLVLLDAKAAWPNDPGLYLWETKSMGKWDRLDWLDIDPQLGTYLWAADEQGMVGIQGVVYEAILTTHWKTDEGEVYKTGPRAGEPKVHHPPADSFRRLVIPRSDALVAETLRQYRVAAARAAEIQADPERAIKSAGRNCVRCPAYSSCHGYAS